MSCLAPAHGLSVTKWHSRMTESQDDFRPLCFYEMVTEVITMSLGQHMQPDAYAVISCSVQPHPGVSAAVLFIHGQRARYLKQDHMRSFTVALKGGEWLKVLKTFCCLTSGFVVKMHPVWHNSLWIIQAFISAKVNSSCVLTWSIVTWDDRMDSPS